MEIQLSVVWAIASLSSAGGGPTRSVLASCCALAEAGLRVAIVSVDYQLPGAGMPRPELRGVELRMTRGRAVPLLRDGMAPAFARELSRFVAEHRVDLIHDNGLWLSTNRAVARVARSRRIPLVVSTRGMLAPWALKHRRWKKRIAWVLYQRRILESAALLHATAEAEAKDIRAAGLKNPIAVIPNAVEIPEALPERERASSKRRVLFLGRLHPVKGLENLLEAWSQVRPQGWELVLAGPDEEGYQARLEAIVRERGLGGEVQFTGAVDGDAKWKLYRSADLFVLPSFTENFGMAVAEALACEVPVITTRGTPWSEVETQGCGWWVETGVEPLVKAMRQGTSLTVEQSLEMGRRGRRLFQENYATARSAGHLKRTYEWILGGAVKPDCIFTN